MRLTCRVCHRDLTTAESRAAGIGPVCATRHGVDAQCELFDLAPRGPAPERLPPEPEVEPDMAAQPALWIAWAVQLELLPGSSGGIWASQRGASGPPTSRASRGTPRASATRSQDALPL